VLVVDGGSRDDTAAVADVGGCNFHVADGPLGRRLPARSRGGAVCTTAQPKPLRVSDGVVPRLSSWKFRGMLLGPARPRYLVASATWLPLDVADQVPKRRSTYVRARMRAIEVCLKCLLPLR
jgi:hypothetical protein